MRLPVRLLPRRWRDRYGDEIADMLRNRRRPLRDGVDVAATAVTARVTDALQEVQMSVTSLLRIAAAVLAGVGLFALGFAVNDLAHGWREVPQHWWSTLPLVVLAGSAGLWALGRGLRRTPAA